MAKPNLSINNASAFVVLDDDETFCGLGVSPSILLIEGEFNDDASMRNVIRAYDQNVEALGEAGNPVYDPMVPVDVSTNDAPNIKVRAISINFLLQHYLSSRDKGGKISVSVDK